MARPTPSIPAAPDDAAKRLIVASDAASRLAVARTWLAALPRDAEVLILAPHTHAADELVRDDAAGFGSRFGVERFTVDHLAARLAGPELARDGLAVATPLTLAAVVARAVHHLLEHGEAGRYADVGRRPGFPHAFVQTLQELRAAGVSAEALRSLPRDGKDLAVIVERVERELADARLADRATLIERATAAVERDGAFPAGLPTLLLDLPLDSARDVAFVAAITRRAPRLLALAPEGDARAIAAIESMIAPVCADRTIGSGGDDSLTSLQRHLFETTSPPQRSLDAGVSVSSWPGEARECVEIARKLQAEAMGGTPFDRMAVFLRAPHVYRAHLTEALRRAAIPAYFAQGTARPDPAGRAFLALLACAAEGLSARRFGEYLSLAQVPDPDRPADDTWTPPLHELIPTVLADDGEPEPETHGMPADPDAAVVEGTLRAPWRWERLLVDAAVIGGRDRWRRRLDGLAREFEVQRSEVADDDARAASLGRVAADLEHLRDFALPLIERLAELPEEATWGAWLDRLTELADAALRQPGRVRAVLAELAPLAPVGPVDLLAVQHVLAPRLGDLTERPEGRPGGAVFVAPVAMARGLVFDVVFVPGLAEKVFPPRIVQDPLLADEARAALPQAALANQDARAAAERLALRLAVGAASRHVALSWPRIDVEQARPRVPSFYGLEAMRAAEGRLPGFDELRSRAETGGRARLGWPAPEQPEHAIDDAEFDLATLARVKDPNAETSRGAAHYLLHVTNPYLPRALRARGRRWLKRWTYADGFVDPDAEAMAALARHRVGARAFSPTALEHYSQCPYRFLLQAVHRLQPREEAEALETIDPLTKGALFHDVQFEVLTKLRDEGRLPLDPDHLEVAYERLEAAVESVAASYEEQLAPAIPRVWADGVQAIRGDLREWLRRSAEDAHGWVPHLFELSFGLADRRRPKADQASVPDAVQVLDGMLVRGSIDLVERRHDGTLRVTDHKTGKVRAEEGAIVGGGKTMQPVLYALVCESMLDTRVESGRLFYCTADGDFTERVIPLDEISRGYARIAVETIGRALESGFLPAAPAKDACRWCDYRPVCGPNEERRTGRKPNDRILDLVALRELP